MLKVFGFDFGNSVETEVKYRQIRETMEVLHLLDVVFCHVELLERVQALEVLNFLDAVAG